MSFLINKIIGRVLFKTSKFKDIWLVTAINVSDKDNGADLFNSFRKLVAIFLVITKKD